MKLRLKRRLQTGTALLCSLVLAFSVVPVSAEESQESLESKTSDLENQLAGINQELLAISNQISTTEMQIEITNSEIQRTKDSLAETQAKEAQQYEDMKTRIKYMYETGSTSLLEMLFSAENMSDFLNKADFIQNISTYDRKMLTEIQETREQIEEKEATVKQQQNSLLTLQDELKQRHSDLAAKAAATSTDLNAFNAQLEQIRAQAAAELAAQAAAKKAEEERLAKEANANVTTNTTPAPQPSVPESSENTADNSTGSYDDTVINGGAIDVAANELDIFAALLDCEAIYDYNSMLAVATVIMNRVESSLFPNSITGVIYASGQFEPVWTGRLNSVLESGASGLAYQVAQDAVNGARLAAVNDCYFFLYAGATNRPGVNIGGNLFFPGW